MFDRAGWLARLPTSVQKPYWRPSVMLCAMEWWMKDVVQGTPRGDRLIMEATGRKSLSEHSEWGGDWVQGVYRSCGFDPSINLCSAGRALYGYGMYNHRLDDTALPWAAVGFRTPLNEPTALAVMSKDFHESCGMMRRVWTPTLDDLPMKGDLVLHQEDKTRLNGRVMLCVGSEKEIETVFVMDGNRYGVGPTGGMRKGLSVAPLDIKPACISCCVRPSPLDWTRHVRYVRTREEAEKMLKEMKRGIS
jgi:hypothetical protein